MASQMTNQSPLATHPFNAGANNQKLAIAGLFCAAYEASRPVRIPRLIDFSPEIEGIHPLKISDVFLEKKITSLLEKFNVQIHDSCEDGALAGVDFFKTGAGILRGYGFSRRIPVDDLFPSMMRSFELTDELNKNKNKIINALRERDVTVSLQLRIENDWKDYSNKTLKERHPTEDFSLSFIEILKKYNNTQYFSGKKNIFACCDERNLPVKIADIKDFSSRALGLNLFFKSDFIPLDEISTTRIGLSLVDFEVCLSMDSYVGLTRSTFSNVLCFTSKITGKEGMHHYIYNSTGQMLRERFDAGCTISPKDAVETSVQLDADYTAHQLGEL